MITLATGTLFFGAALLLALAPGPDNLFVLTQSALHGRRAGMRVVLGLCTGLLGHTAAVALGLAALLAASPNLFALLKIIGALYLIYLAWQVFRAPADPAPSAAPSAGAHWRLYGRGVVMNLTNPKVSLFFLAFLPQFTDPARGPVAWQIVALGVIFIAATLLVFGAIALFAGAVGGFLQRSGAARRWLNRAAAALFLGLAARIAFD